MLLSVVFGAGFTKLVQCEIFGDAIFFSHNRFRKLIRGWNFGDRVNGSAVKTMEQVRELEANARLAGALAEKSKANVAIFVPITALLFIAMSLR